MCKKILLTFFSIAVLFSCSGCPFWVPEQPTTVEEEELDLEVVWRVPVNVGGFTMMDPLFESSIAYVPERHSKGLCAINLDTGSLDWRVENIAESETEIQRIDNKLYYFMSWTSAEGFARIAVCSIIGEYQYAIILGDAHYRNRTFNFGLLDSNLLWATGNSDSVYHGLVTINVETDLVWDPVNEEYTAQPRTIYETEEEILSDPLIENGVVFFIHFDQIVNSSTHATLVALDLETEVVRWTANIFPMLPNASHSLIIEGDYLYVFRDGLMCFDKNTGEHIYSNLEVGQNTAGVYHEGYLYGTCYSNRGEFPLISCADAITGETVWTVPMADIGWDLGSTPQVHEGILYVAGPAYLRLYDAMTGEYLGRDSEIWGDFYQLAITHKHNDLFIINNGAELLAVRMDYHLQRNSNRLF